MLDFFCCKVKLYVRFYYASLMLCEARMFRRFEPLGLGLCDSNCVVWNQVDRTLTPRKWNYFHRDFSETNRSFSYDMFYARLLRGIRIKCNAF